MVRSKDTEVNHGGKKPNPKEVINKRGCFRNGASSLHICFTVKLLSTILSSIRLPTRHHKEYCHQDRILYHGHV